VFAATVTVALGRAVGLAGIIIVADGVTLNIRGGVFAQPTTKIAIATNVISHIVTPLFDTEHLFGYTTLAR
jgi:hypothetical protein